MERIVFHMLAGWQTSPPPHFMFIYVTHIKKTNADKSPSSAGRGRSWLLSSSNPFEDPDLNKLILVDGNIWKLKFYLLVLIDLIMHPNCHWLTCKTLTDLLATFIGQHNTTEWRTWNIIFIEENKNREYETLLPLLHYPQQRFRFSIPYLFPDSVLNVLDIQEAYNGLLSSFISSMNSEINTFHFFSISLFLTSSVLFMMSSISFTTSSTS